MQLGLIGKKLGHSYSKIFFEKFFRKHHLNHSYELFELKDICEFPILIKHNPNLIGLNITVPYKTKILSYVDILDETVQAVGATNCLVISHGIHKNKIQAFNTDVLGFAKSFRRQIGNRKFTKALVLGSGGASAAVAYVLKNQNISYSIVSRSKKPKGYTYAELNAEIIAEHHLIVQCTPLGMSPDIHSTPPFPYQYLKQEHFVIDLIYNPEQSKFLQLASLQGAQTYNGLEMLKEQAIAAWKIWEQYT